MKVILLQDVAKIGRKSQIVDVPDGYALNKLIPKKMAEPATATNQKRIERMNASQEATSDASKNRFETALDALRAKTLQIATEVNDQGHTFKAVHEPDVVKAASEAGVDIDEKMLSMDSHIKSVGEHEIELVTGDVKAKFTIEVVKK